MAQDDILGAYITGPDLIRSGKGTIFRIDDASGPFFLVRPLLGSISEPGTLLHATTSSIDFIAPRLVYGALRPADLIHLQQLYESGRCPQPIDWPPHPDLFP